jgi:hypothetical protein
MADWVTISSLATAGGTLVLAVATFSSVKSANRSAQVAERSLLAGVQPVLIPSREDDSVERVRFGDEQTLTIAGHGGAVIAGRYVIYLAMGVRNGGSGLAVIHGWHIQPRTPAADGPPDVDEFRRQNIDLYIPAGDTGPWLGALRDPKEHGYEDVRRAVVADEPLALDLLYGDYEGGQRTIARFVLGAWPEGSEHMEGRRAFVIRYWNVDRDDPR